MASHGRANSSRSPEGTRCELERWSQGFRRCAPAFGSQLQAADRCTQALAPSFAGTKFTPINIMMPCCFRSAPLPRMSQAFAGMCTNNSFGMFFNFEYSTV
eukprot:3428114-Amphidinium_carterae.2